MLLRKTEDMAYADLNRTVTAQTETGLAGKIDALRTRFAKWRLYRTTLNELRELSARELNDLGLNQSSIKRVALEAAYGKAA